MFGGNGGHGLLIAGAGTGDIYIEQSNFGVNINDNGKYGNQGSGIAILGDQEGSPYDISFYVCYVGDNKQYGVFLSKVAPPKDKPVTFTFVRNGHVGFGPWDRDRWAPNTLGCWRLEDGTRNVVMRGGEYVGSPVGIWFDGEGTSYNCQNLGDIVGTTEAAVLITNGAHHNELLGVKVHHNLGKGIVIDESDDNIVGPFDRKELWGPDEEFAYTRALGLEPFVDPLSLCGADPCYGTVAGCGDVGVLISGDADRNLIRGQMIEGNNGDGILLEEKIGTMSVPDSTEISSCFFGSPALGGSSALEFKPNKGAGVHIAGAENTLIKDCRIESNYGPGILLERELTWNTAIVGNMIGRTSADMPADMGNGQAGIEVLRGPKKTIIGGHKPSERNVISGNKGPGILASGSDIVGLKIFANYIGTDPEGRLDMGNDGEGIRIEGVEEVVIRGRNLISGNEGDGILLVNVRDALVMDNVIGAKEELEAAMQNEGCGIRMDRCSHNTITNNEILATGHHGIQVSGGGWNRIISNDVGASNRSSYGKVGTHGIFLMDGSQDNTVAFNLIRNADGHGIAVGDPTNPSDAPVRNSLSGNSITGCTGRAIALLTAGAQGGIRAPEILSVHGDHIYGRVFDVPDGSVVELFADTGTEAETSFGMAEVRGGRFDFRGPVPPDLNVAATVTDLERNTSELFCITGPYSLTRPILFVSTRDGNGDIYKTSTVLGLATPLTSDPSEDRDPAWSGDGRFVAFASDRDGDYDIYIMEAEGDQVRRLTQGEWDDRMPSWSPDGERIAFVSDRDGNREIYIVNSDGTGLTRLTHDPGDDVMPSWSPDGNRIAFASDRDGDYDIYLVNPDGSGLTRLTYSSGDDTDPCWSPDGSRIAFASDRSGLFQIYTVPAEGGDAVLFVPTDLPARYPSWSPDGSRIAFAMEKDTDTEVYIAGMVPVQATISRGMDTYPAWGRR